jgi:hypothetical protein
MGKTPFPMIVIFCVCVCVRDKVSGHPVRKECLPMLMLSISQSQNDAEAKTSINLETSQE